MTKQISYVVVTPARDEAKYLSLTIDSLAAQSIKPARWVIVNDGSKDETGLIASEAAKSHGWITAVNRIDRGFRKAGGGVVDAFYEGYQCVVELVHNQFVDDLGALRRACASEKGADLCFAAG